MDNLTHSLVGLTAAKAGLEKLSPHTTIVCLLSANAADADFIALVFGDRWTLLQHHRGITHSIVGTLAIGLIVPALVLLIERIISLVRKRRSQIRPLGLLLASLIAATTHPILDWTNNYGVRPFLPWSGRWFYGDLVFIADPYIWLGLGGIVFLLTSDKRWKLFGWSIIGAIATLVLVAASTQEPAVRMALVIWLLGLSCLVIVRMRAGHQGIGRRAAAGALCGLVVYWGCLALVHQLAVSQTSTIASNLAASHSEQVLRTATMPSAATPFRWQSVAETNAAFYKFGLRIGSGDANQSDGPVARFEKPTGRAAQLISIAGTDRRARVLLDFARFPLTNISSTDCIGQTLVQIGDLRYTEPGRVRGNFSVNIPIDCASQ